VQMQGWVLHESERCGLHVLPCGKVVCRWSAVTALQLCQSAEASHADRIVLLRLLPQLQLLDLLRLLRPRDGSSCGAVPGHGIALAARTGKRQSEFVRSARSSWESGANNI